MKSILLVWSALAMFAWSQVGAPANTGTLANPKVVERLEITEPGIYENILVDGNWQGGNRVKITADGVTLRHCEIRNVSGNAIGIFGNKTVIEFCKIHHCLAGNFKEQTDSHGISGRWGDTIIRNCEIAYTSGDSVQFDPDRQSTGTVTIENCTFWTGPLPEAAAGFAKGERPGENAIDTKTPDGPERCKLIVRNCYFHGWQQPAAIANAAVFNLKETVEAHITGCVLGDCEIAFRLRGPGRNKEGALVTIEDCAIYNAEVGVRAEDLLRGLTIRNLAFGEGVKEKYRFASQGLGEGYVNEGETTAPPLKERLQLPAR